MYFKISLALGIFSAILYYYGFEPFNFVKSLLENTSPASSAEPLFTNAQLSKFNGVDSDLLYLSVMGKVYDVTKGSKHYGPGSNYHIFTGRDASRSFITGEFTDTSKELDDVLSLSPNDLIGLENWAQMYEKQYIYKGKLIGRFYDYNGAETEYFAQVKNKLEEAKNEKLLKDQQNVKYPPCNAEWDVNSGSRMWCSKKSGGVSRNWEGVPRLLYSPGMNEPHCVCLNINDESLINNPNLKEYEGCDPLSTSCNIKI